jgi:hypothetical protein
MAGKIGRLTQRESATFTRWKSLVQIQYRLPCLSRVCLPSGWQTLFFIKCLSRNRQICLISALREKFNPRNINHMPAVKFFVRLDLDQICLFLDGH